MTKTIVISVDELWLKGKNKKMYLQSIVGHLDTIFKAYHETKFTLSKQGQRLYYSSEVDFSSELIEALTCVPGISSITPCKILDLDKEFNLENMYEEILEQVGFLNDTPMTFRASVIKNHPKLPQTSVEVEREIGHRVLVKYPKAKVSLEKFELKIEARIYGHYLIVSTRTYKGMGGLPWGSNGHALCLLSGGFDSPVASYMMSKRGIRQDFIFFHAYPYVGREVLTKIKNLASRLTAYQRQAHLYVVPFGNIQNLITENCQEEYRTMFFRKAMVEVANIISEKIGAHALITGDSLGQVSSQTLKNMHFMDKASERMIMRPLLGFNKLEIITLAKKIKTHDISIIPHDDACALFAPKNPVINPSDKYWESVDTKALLQEEYAKVFETTEAYSMNLKGELYKKDFFSYDRY